MSEYAEQVERISANVASTYTALSEMGAIMPAQRSSDNLPGTVRTVPQGGGSVDTSGLEEGIAIATHSALIAGEGALVMPWTEAYTKKMNGEIIMGDLVHASDKTFNLADLEAGFSMMYSELSENLSGVYGTTFEVPPRAVTPEVFDEVCFSDGGVTAIQFELGVIISIPTDRFAMGETVFPKKGIYMSVGMSAFRINGYSFSSGSGETAGGIRYVDTLTWDGDLTGKTVVTTAAVKYVHMCDSLPTETDIETIMGSDVAGIVTVVSGQQGVSETMTIAPDDIIFGLLGNEYVVSWGPTSVFVYPQAANIPLQQPDGTEIVFPKSGIYFVSVQMNDVTGYTAELTIPGFQFDVGGGSSSVAIPDATKFYLSPDESPMYLYKSADTENASNRVTAAELKEAVNSGIKFWVAVGEGVFYLSPINVQFGVKDGAEIGVVMGWLGSSYLVLYTTEY